MISPIASSTCATSTDGALHRLARAITIGLFFSTISACDNRQAFRKPDPTLARMLEQRRADPYAPSGVFADGMAMRPTPRGVVARDDDTTEAKAPPPITREALAKGRVTFETICATCHGILGDGKSAVATKMRERPPPSLHVGDVPDKPAADLFAIVSDGYGLMPGYAEMLSVDERWAVLAYLKALQLSRRAHVADLPKSMREELVKETP